MKSTRRVLIKVCGIRRPEEAPHALDSGASWLGLNFHPASPRCIDRGEARAIVRAIERSGRRAAEHAVGLFVDHAPGEIRAILRDLGLVLVQVHRRFEPGMVRDLRGEGFRVIQTWRLGGRDDLAGLRADLEDGESRPDFVLVDALVPGGPAGGTGHALPETLLTALADLPWADTDPPDTRAWPPLILAGGLRPENVAERLGHLRPWMVDVASGVESAPGVKDPGRVAEFCRAVRSLDLGS